MSKQSKTILITGGCGFVGKNLIHHLQKNSLYDKLVVCCHSHHKNKNTGKTIYVKADLLKPESYEPIFNQYQPDDIIHLAAIARFKQGEENPEDTVKANFFGTMRPLNLAKQHKAKRFLLVSSNMARNPKGVTGLTKYLAEAYIKTMVAPPDVFSIRLPNVVDSPGAVTLIFKKQIEEGKTVTLTDKRMSRKFVSPEQSAKDLLFALNNGHHGNIFVNNKPSTPIVELAREMIKKSGKNIPVTFIGMRPGEKLEEEDYPADTVCVTGKKDIFLLTENQHKPENILQSIELLTGKISLKTINKIKALFNLK